MRWLALLLLAVALVAVGCGGDDESASDETTIEETTTTEETTTSEETTDETTDTDLSGILADEDCVALAGAGAAFAQVFAGGGATTEESSAALQELVDKVPDEIEADVRILADAFAQYAAELQDIGLEAGATPTAEQLQELQAALASIDQENVTAASERLEAWATENCEAAGG